MPAYPKIAIIGVGLIGGSIGLALKERGLAGQVLGVGRRQSSLDKAMNCGAIDHATTSLEEGVANSDLVIVATPVGQVVDDVTQVLATTNEAIVTDVGSTKATICQCIDKQIATAKRFVGSHPLAGDHRTGPENARADLLVDKTVVVTPTTTTGTATTEKIQEFWQSLGARVVQMSPTEHDLALASTSHLPHLVASALAAATPKEFLPLAATGWADTTRVAAGDPELWTQIFAQNTPDLMAALEKLIAELQQTHDRLNKADWSSIQNYLALAKRTRDALGN